MQNNTLPEFARWINPVLCALHELGGSARPREVVERVAHNEHVSDAALDQLNPAGGQRFPNQVHWARFYLADAGYIDRSKHGVWKLTDTGADLSALDGAALEALVREVQARSTVASKVAPAVSDTALDTSIEATETLAESDAGQSETLAPDQEDVDYRSKLSGILKSLAPAGFERLCQRLLREAGFEQVIVTGKDRKSVV